MLNNKIVCSIIFLASSSIRLTRQKPKAENSLTAIDSKRPFYLYFSLQKKVSNILYEFNSHPQSVKSLYGQPRQHIIITN